MTGFLIRSPGEIATPAADYRLLPEPPVGGYTRYYSVGPRQATPIASIRDETGASDLVQSNSSYRPTLVMDGDWPAAHFDGVNDYMEASFGAAAPSTVCVVLRVPTVSLNKNVIGFSGLWLNVGPSGTWRIGDFGGAEATTDRVAITAVNNGGSGSIIAVGAAAATGNSGTPSGGGFLVLPALEAYISEIRVYPFALSVQQALDMNAWNRARWIDGE